MAEIAEIAEELASLVGAQIQECLQTKTELGLGFYHEREMLWLWFDFDPLRPMVVRLSAAPPRKKETHPLTLFLRKRFLGRRLKAVRADLERGRVLILEFHRARDEEEQGAIELELRLFPHGQNAIARDGSKSISEYKPKDVPAVTGTGQAPPPRPWSEIEAQWSARNQTGAGRPQAAQKEQDSIERDYKKALEKKAKALERMREELALKTTSLWSDVGEWLKANRTLEVPAEWREHIDPKKSLSWNIEECFRKAKENARKAEGTRERLALVENELESLKTEGVAGFQRAREKTKKGPAGNLLAGAEARGRRFQVSDDLEAYIGKSAADNLAILRRAQSFDYWLHLRDQPGSHAILRRTRGRNVTDEEFRRAGTWVIEQSLGKRAHELKGERFDLLIVECRFVRPIKGDKLGRVNYTNDRVMSLRF